MAALIGSQLPSVSHHPKGTTQDAEDCAELAGAYGLVLDEWQENVLQAWMRRASDGKWAAGRWGIACPRQNGKNGILEAVELYFMAVLGLKILHTAHEVKTARKAFIRIASFFENERLYPELAALVKEIRKTNGQEAIVLTNGGSVEFIARSKGSGRGFTVDVLVCDEAQEYSEDAQAALLPTISSAPSGDPLQILLGTPPGPGMAGDVFTRMRTAGQEGKDRRLAWCEWSVSGNVKVGDRAHWLATNPSVGKRLNISTIEDEHGAMSPEMFARERLGRWDANGGRKAIPDAPWDALAINPEHVPAEGRRCFAVRFTIDGASVALAAAIRPESGPIHIEGIKLASMGEGTGWLVDWLVERADRAAQIVVEGKSGVGYLVNALREEKVGAKVIITPTVEQVVDAHSMFESALQAGEISHRAQKDLDDQAKAAEKRKIGVNGGFGWAAPEGGSVALLDAVTMAHWAAKTTKRNPGRRQSFL